MKGICVCIAADSFTENLKRVLFDFENIADEVIIISPNNLKIDIDLCAKYKLKLFQFNMALESQAGIEFGLTKAERDWVLFMFEGEFISREVLILIREKLSRPFKSKNGYYLTVRQGIAGSLKDVFFEGLQLRLFNRRRILGAKANAAIDNIYFPLNKEAKTKNGVFPDIVLLKNLSANQDVKKNAGQMKEEVKTAQTVCERLVTEVITLRENIKGFFDEASKQVKQLYEASFYTEALELLKEVLALFPGQAYFIYLKGLICKETKYYGKAIEYLELALDQARAGDLYWPENEKYNWLAIGHTLGELYQELGDTEQAIHYYKLGIAEKRQNIDSIYKFGDLIIKEKGIRDGLKELETYFDLDYPYSLGTLADILCAHNYYEHALPYLDRAIAKIGYVDAEFVCFKGKCLLHTGKVSQAIELLEKIPPESEFFYFALEDLCWCKWLQNDLNTAAALLEKLTQSPMHVNVIEVYKRFHLLLQGAKEMSILSYEPDNSRAWSKYILQVLEKALSLGNEEKIIKVLILPSLVKDLTLPDQIGKMLFKYGKSELAAAYLKQSIQNGTCDADTFAALDAALAS